MTEDATAPAVPSETEAKPIRWRTLRTPDGLRPSPRQQQRDARNRAEAWYQAVRDWQTRWREEVVSSRSANTTRPPSNNIVGQYTSGGSLTGLGYRVVHTPLGWLSESAVATAISRQGGLLERARQGQGLSTLIHSSGQGWNGPEAKEYARALLSLAATLGDACAPDHLSLLKLGD